MSMFQKATKKKSKARIALTGPSGSGKTYTALRVAKGLGKKVAVIDTERGSASKYAGDVATFDVCELATFEPQKFISALKGAAAAGYDVVVIDSLSHAWMGEGGIIDQKDKRGGEGFAAWRTLTPQHNALVDAILAYPGHVIVTMRSKTEYLVEKDAKGKSVPRKVGLAPVQRDGIEFEFDIVGEIDVDHTLHVSKSRCSALADASIRTAGEDMAKTLLDWLDQGEEARPTMAATQTAESPQHGQPRDGSASGPASSMRPATSETSQSKTHLDTRPATDEVDALGAEANALYAALGVPEDDRRAYSKRILGDRKLSRLEAARAIVVSLRETVEAQEAAKAQEGGEQ